MKFYDTLLFSCPLFWEQSILFLRNLFYFIHEQFIAYKMELQIAYCVCTKIPKESVLPGEESSNREDIETAVRVERPANKSQVEISDF